MCLWLMHQTTDRGLLAILRSGQIRPSAKLGQAYTHVGIGDGIPLEHVFFSLHRATHDQIINQSLPIVDPYILFPLSILTGRGFYVNANYHAYGHGATHAFSKSATANKIRSKLNRIYNANQHNKYNHYPETNILPQVMASSHEVFFKSPVSIAEAKYVVVSPKWIRQVMQLNRWPTIRVIPLAPFPDVSYDNYVANNNLADGPSPFITITPVTGKTRSSQIRTYSAHRLCYWNPATRRCSTKCPPKTSLGATTKRQCKYRPETRRCIRVGI
jgi:hypothetical protein